MKYLVLSLILAPSAFASLSFTAKGLKEINIESALQIECQMAVTEIKERLRKIKKDSLANACKMGVDASGKQVYLASVIILD